MTVLNIQELTSQVVKAGALMTEVKFIVVNEAGDLVGKKAHATREEAERELEGRAGYAEGLAFAKAVGFEGTKGAVSKANCVADYLAWVAAGKPESMQADAPAAEEGEQF